MTKIEKRTLVLLLRDNLKHNSQSKDCCSSRTLKSYERKVRRGMKSDVWEKSVEATNEESAAMLRELQ